MSELYTAVNEIIGDASKATGILYYTNWSTGATPGAGAIHAITLNRKIEGIPPVFEPDPSTYFPVYMWNVANRGRAYLGKTGNNISATLMLRYIILQILL